MLSLKSLQQSALPETPSSTGINIHTSDIVDVWAEADYTSEDDMHTTSLFPTCGKKPDVMTEEMKLLPKIYQQTVMEVMGINI